MSAGPSGIVGVFDRAADTYDAVGVEWFGPIARGLVRELAPQPGGTRPRRRLRTGAALEPLAAAVGSGGYALGIDLAPRMVAATAEDLRDVSQVEVRVGDGAAPGLTASSFDVVASCLVLFFLTDPVAAVGAWRDLLRPAGRLGVATFGTQDPRWVAVDDLFRPYLPPALLDARTSGTRGPFASDAGMADLLSGAGLSDVRTAVTTVDVCFADPEQWLEFSWSNGQRVMWEAVPVERHESLQRAAFELLTRFRRDDGAIVFNQEVRYTLGRRP